MISNEINPTAQDVSFTTTPEPKKKGSMLAALALLFSIFTFLCLLAYIGYNESKNKPADESVLTTPTTVGVSVTTAPTTSTITPTETTITLTHKLDELVGGKKFSLQLPSTSVLNIDTNDSIATITDQTVTAPYTMTIQSQYEDEGLGGTPYGLAYTKLSNSKYSSDFYRVQSKNPESDPNEYFYVGGENFKSTGACEGPYTAMIGAAEAPCGDGMLSFSRPGADSVDLLLIITCKAEQEEGLKKCDAIVESIEKV